MSKLETNTIDNISGSSTLTIGDSNTSTITLKSGATLTNFPTNTPAFKAFRNGSQTVADVTSTVIQYNGESFDTDSAYDTSTYRFTCPSGKAGRYLFSAHAYIFQSAASLYSCDFQIRLNGANQSFDQVGLDSSDNYSYVPKSTTILNLSVGDYVDVAITGNTNDGGSFTVFGNSPYNYSVFQGHKLIG